MSKKEIVEMFELQDKDYKVIFEYDTIEELERLIEIAKSLKQTQIKQEKEDNNEISKKVNYYDTFSFFDLELEFVAYQRKIGKVSDASYKAYSSTFSKLKKHFKKIDIRQLNFQDFEDFRDNLIAQNLDNKTINNNIQYLNYFLDFAMQRDKIEKNYAKAITTLKETKNKIENFNDKEINTILEYVLDKSNDFTIKKQNCDYLRTIFVIAIFSGMRFHEILDIKQENIKLHNQIYYFDILDSKTENGIRKVPLHPFLYQFLNEQHPFSFKLLYPLCSSEKNKYNKQVLNMLYKIIPKNDIGTKTFHTLRGTFTQKLVNINSQELPLIQEIIGHSHSSSNSLTLNTYAKEFYLEKKLDLIEKVRY